MLPHSGPPIAQVATERTR